jgi:hypothetical protein
MYVLQAGLADSIMDASFPVIPGWDVAGVVERVGAGVTEFAAGDEVIGFVREEILRHGTYAEKIAVPVSTLVRRPRNADVGASSGTAARGAHGISGHRSHAEADEGRDRTHSRSFGWFRLLGRADCGATGCACDRFAVSRQPQVLAFDCRRASSLRRSSGSGCAQSSPTVSTLFLTVLGAGS